MRFAILALCVVLSIIGTAAFDQEAHGEARSAPSGSDVVMRFYPPVAQEQGVEGIGVICCTVEADGSLSCAVPYEWPEGYGFGEATLSVSRHFRVEPPPENVAQENWLKRVIRWTLPDSRNPGGGREFAEALEAARAVTCEVPHTHGDADDSATQN